ncbi:MAG: chromosomal replication initiator protein DnaA [Deferribacteraceae bacterium]|jgi:chromosomal replication initiator protein|nr:chromosomal replication initiator protein DnaA [Deferribacteraceae bacterium]
MLSTNETLWESILKSLSEKYKVPEEMINIWLKPTKIVNISAAEITIKCKSKFFRDMIEQNYLKDIQKILEEEFSIAAAVKIFWDKSTPKEESKENIKVDVSSYPKSVPGLNSNMTFERFVVGDSNVFAYKTSRAVAEGNFSIYNPLIIYGDTGLGKTHLMSAVGNRIHKDFPKMKMLYIESKQFLQEIISLFAANPGKDGRRSTDQEKVVSVKERYFEADLLMFDDIQFLTTPKGQEIFFDIFNDLHNHNKQIVITSDKTPQQLDIEDRLRSRFSGGVLLAIDPPSSEEKVAILFKKADEANIIIEQDVAFFLSENIKVNDVRSLEGALKTAALKASLNNAPLSKEHILQVLKEQRILKTTELFTPTTDALINAVTQIFNAKKGDLYSQKRTKNIAHIRQITMYLLRDKLSLSLKEIGSLFNKDHSTVSYAIKQVAKQLETDKHLAEVLSKIMEQARSTKSDV